ncbi:MAG: type II secretion system secretin GspD [Lentisphaerae bacterium]|nr:type II secretion system secretin GspD [Lentisphaerota bacterium]
MKELQKYERTFTRKVMIAGLASAMFVSASSLGQRANTVPVDTPPRLTFQDSPLEFVLAEYSDKTGRTILQAPNVPKANITLKSQGDLTFEEYLQAIETVLSMHGIALLKVGDKFLKVVPIKSARQEAMTIGEDLDRDLAETDELVSQMIPLKHIEPNEAKKAIDALKHAHGVVHVFERINSILVTDSAANLNRIMQILRSMDQPIEAREEPNIVAIRHAKASEIKSKLIEIIAESQKNANKQISTIPSMKESGSPGVETTPSVPTPPGVIRARRKPEAAPPEETAIPDDLIAEAERGIIRGTVQIVSDDRTNILIIITRPENMAFFEKIIKVLDVETAPDVIVRVFRLEFAEAKTIASMLNTLIGAKSGKDDVAPVTAPETGTGESAALRDYVARKEKALAERAEKTSIGELSAKNIKILSDERTNSLIIMASQADLVAIAEIINDMDMMLSQVLIEAVIIEVQLGDEFMTGIDWVQRSMIAYDRDGNSISPIMAFAGAGGGGSLTAVDASTTPTFPSGGGLAYYFTLFGLTVDMVVQAVSKDDRTRVISSPVILTTDNTDATITSTEQIYVFQGKKRDQYGGDYDDYTTKDVGLTLNVKPHINANKVVMMDIKQTMSEPGAVGEPQSGARVSSSRTLNASVAVKDRQTVVLGGQVRSQKVRNRTKIPLLGSIPLLGRLFSHVSQSEVRREMVVFITPYVVDTESEMAAETMRRKRALDIDGMWERGWSNSELAEPTKDNLAIQEGQDQDEKENKKSIERKKRRKQAEIKERQTAAEKQVAEQVEKKQPEKQADLVNQEPDKPIEPAESAAEQPAQTTNPVLNADPALLEFIKRQEKRWGKAVRQADKAVDEAVEGF